ncbi:hypothetical protein METBIDRAFT_80169 [Metschnikowia bicuspidata var. bicuspidata NRRL YB-4993]|uniref:Uncharacterized protein n=1 Tax=Metschnikowia bicuspidata var. bicuspidata NRRL YB-4993 TaxID=869754 RepID=A0A1A0GZ77_9ASCO|nr:hypothetical protein METBIDRAFT_80169 [Metschnikowia bicuspidata var. bicuspidata NRRL YB-4993]OBA17002.1 hypothetical protein METBIDRAFT_80169 [Metschnikowia bicuspidata var. bicuspidata NRRL YB-4993]
MTCNQELQSELQLVTSELAFSIKREIALEAKIRSKSRLPDSSDSSKLASTDSLERSKTISELQEKLNKERKLRFISEEHAILAEHGQSPSALKLDYEKNEIYNQLLAKNDMVIQLQDKLDDIAATQSKDVGNDLVGRFNDLLKENAALKSKLEKSEAETNSHSGSGLYLTKATPEEFYHECDQAAIMSLKTQRDELRDTITKITSSRNVELKVAQEKIKILEAKLEKVNSINSKLSKRMEKSVSSNGSAHFTSGQGGKLQGFSIIAPSKKVLDD